MLNKLKSLFRSDSRRNEFEKRFKDQADCEIILLEATEAIGRYTAFADILSQVDPHDLSARAIDIILKLQTDAKTQAVNKQALLKIQISKVESQLKNK
jgi:hypothetical protein